MTNMDDREVPIKLQIGNITAKVVASVARSPNVNQALAQLLHAVADQIYPPGGDDHAAEGEGEAQPSGSAGTAALR